MAHLLSSTFSSEHLDPSELDLIVSQVINEAELRDSHIHGVQHWNMVERNGVYLCQHNDADEKVVRLFALFHDCQRLNDGYDKEHGPRAAHYAKTFRDRLDLNEKQLAQLLTACKSHTFGKVAPDSTVGTCWDSDRLEIGRVGIQPDERFMTNHEAKRIAREKDFATLRGFQYESIF